ncbi:MAG: sugar phosphate isomerase/epimerase [Paenibacillaceae bacterium]|nr:sugar phosphate isomerase/epimerase [Paenibacillaceae bacterium]
MLKGVNQWCFPEGTPLDSVLAVSKEAGYDAIELNLYESAHAVGLHKDMTAAQAEAIGEQVRSRGLQLRSLSCGLFGSMPLSSPDESVRENGRKLIEKQIELAALLGIRSVLVIPGFVNNDVSYEQCYARSLEELKRIVPLAERRQVLVGIENVGNRFLLSPLEMIRYIDALDSPQVGSYFDVGNVLPFGGIPQMWIRLLRHRIFNVHVKDFRLRVGNANGLVPLLAGDVDWKMVREALVEVGYDDTVTAEISPYAQDPYQAVYDSARHIAVILGGAAR